jgi:hypothetical protein
MNFLRRLFRRQPQTFPAPSVDLLIARRAMRLHNRSPRGAAAYERVHAILSVRK